MHSTVFAATFAQISDKPSNWLSGNQFGDVNARRSAEFTEAVAKVVTGLSQISGRCFCSRQLIMEDVQKYAAEFKGHDQAQLELVLREVSETSVKLLDRSVATLRRIGESNTSCVNLVGTASTFLKETGAADEDAADCENSIEKRIERALGIRAEEVQRGDAERQSQYAVKREQFEMEFAERRQSLLQQYANLNRELDVHLVGDDSFDHNEIF